MRPQEELRYLAMRAKKMTARLTNNELPSVADLQSNFMSKGTEISKDEAELLLHEVKVHRGIATGSKLGNTASQQGEQGKTEKPQPKQEVAQPNVQKTSRSFGR